MTLILSTLGFIGAGIFVLILVLVSAFITVKVYFRRLACESQENTLLIEKIPIPYQARISLTPKYKRDLIFEDEMENWISTIEKLGYQKINDAQYFEISCTSKISLFIFENKVAHSYAIFYEGYSFNDPYFKFIKIYADHSVKCVTNFPFDSAPSPSRYETLYVSDHSIHKALKLFNQKFSQENLLYLDDQEFIAFLEYMYAEQYNHLIHLHYIDEQYLQTLIAASDNCASAALNADIVQKLQQHIAFTYQLNTPNILLKTFISANPQYSDNTQQLVVIHERQTAEEIWHKYFINIFIELDYDSDSAKIIEKNYLGQQKQEELDAIKTELMNHPFQYMDAILKHVTNHINIKHIGDVNYPIKCSIFMTGL